MKCKECGNKLREGTVFCSKCGCKVEITEKAFNIGRLMSSGKSKLFIGIGCAAIALILITVGFVWKSGNVSEEDEPEIVQPLAETVNEAIKDDAEDEIIEEADVDYSEYGVVDTNITNYNDPLLCDYNNYVRYESGIERFNFSFPAFLFNKMMVINEGAESPVDYGDVIQQVDLWGSDDSTYACFGMYKNDLTQNGYTDFQSMTDYVYEKESQAIYHASTVINGLSKAGDRGTVILRGYLDSNEGSDRVYVLCRIEQEHIYRMYLSYPKAVSDEDDLNKWYYNTEVYRMCDYSGSTKGPIPMDEFKVAFYDNFAITSKDEAALKEVVEWYWIDGVDINEISKKQIEDSLYEAYQILESTDTNNSNDYDGPIYFEKDHDGEFWRFTYGPIYRLNGSDDTWKKHYDSNDGNVFLVSLFPRGDGHGYEVLDISKLR